MITPDWRTPQASRLTTSTDIRTGWILDAGLKVLLCLTTAFKFHQMCSYLRRSLSRNELLFDPHNWQDLLASVTSKDSTDMRFRKPVQVRCGKTSSEA